MQLAGAFVEHAVESVAMTPGEAVALNRTRVKPTVDISSSALLEPYFSCEVHLQ